MKNFILPAPDLDKPVPMLRESAHFGSALLISVLAGAVLANGASKAVEAGKLYGGVVEICAEDKPQLRSPCMLEPISVNKNVPGIAISATSLATAASIAYGARRSRRFATAARTWVFNGSVFNMLDRETA